MHWELYAIRYATTARAAPDCFAEPELIADIPMGLDFFTWIARAGSRLVAIDSGFSRAVAERRNRPRLAEPATALAALGLAPEAVTDLVITHLHYDHAGNLDVFPNATLHIQAAETAYATGPRMCDAHERLFFEAADIATFTGLLHAGRVRFHEGAGEVAPGLSVHLAAGHTAGTQCVRVATARGNVVLASDAVHYYGNFLWRNPFPAIWERAAMEASWDLLAELADTCEHIVPGHDPEVMAIYPHLPNSAGLAVACLHEPPTRAPAIERLRRAP